jgi:hypothetical protein
VRKGFLFLFFVVGGIKFAALNEADLSGRIDVMIQANAQLQCICIVFV